MLRLDEIGDEQRAARRQPLGSGLVEILLLRVVQMMQRQRRDDEVDAEHPIPPVERRQLEGRDACAVAKRRQPCRRLAAHRLRAIERGQRRAAGNASAVLPRASPSPDPSSRILNGSSGANGTAATSAADHLVAPRHGHRGNRAIGRRVFLAPRVMMPLRRHEAPAVRASSRPASTSRMASRVEAMLLDEDRAPTASRPCRRAAPAPPPAARSARRRAPTSRDARSRR